MIAAVIAVGTLYSSNVPEEKIRINIHSCKTNLDLIGFLLKTYAEDNIQYPSADQWCDILTETNSFIEDKYWTCPQAGSGKCHYAINPNTKPDSPASMVLVFETKAGWNQHGNQDIVVMNRHEESGCYILFNDKHVEFIQAEKIKTLQWE